MQVRLGLVGFLPQKRFYVSLVQEARFVALDVPIDFSRRFFLFEKIKYPLKMPLTVLAVLVCKQNELMFRSAQHSQAQLRVIDIIDVQPVLKAVTGSQCFEPFTAGLHSVRGHLVPVFVRL